VLRSLSGSGLSEVPRPLLTIRTWDGDTRSLIAYYADELREVEVDSLHPRVEEGP
jgi:hypothetical protein